MTATPTRQVEHRTGPPRPPRRAARAVRWPRGRAAYRIVQEALTNAVRHSGAARVTVDVRREPGAVVVRVDDGTGGGGAGGTGVEEGNGLRGMRERAASVGGQVLAGPGPAGGFGVRARLPLGADRDGQDGQMMKESA